MEIYTGKTISKGIAIGKLYFYAKDKQQVKLVFWMYGNCLQAEKSL